MGCLLRLVLAIFAFLAAVFLLLSLAELGWFRNLDRSGPPALLSRARDSPLNGNACRCGLSPGVSLWKTAPSVIRATFRIQR